MSETRPWWQDLDEEDFEIIRMDEEEDRPVVRQPASEQTVYCGDCGWAFRGKHGPDCKGTQPASEPASEQDVDALAGSIASVLNRASLGLARFSDYEQAVTALSTLAALAAARGDTT